MKFRRRRRMHTTVEASSLSDILFFLMLFFLMISTLASPEAIKVLLPNASTSKTVPKHALNVTIDNKLNWYVEDKSVDDVTIKPILLAVAAKYNNEVTIVLRVDKKIAVEEMIKLVDIANQLNMPLVVATERAK